MVALLKRLTGHVGLVGDVLQKPQAYPNVRNGFVRDRQNLRDSAVKTATSLNRNIKQYGK